MDPLALLARHRLRHTTSLCARCLSRATPPSARRHVHSSGPLHKQQTASQARKQDDTENPAPVEHPAQAYPLRGYYSDILSATFRPHPAPRTRPPSQAPAIPNAEPQQQPQAQTPDQPSPSTPEDQSPASKLSIVFGTRLASPGYNSTRYNPTTMPPQSTWRTINGVPIPPRPAEPDNCCMSGCVHCVWDDWRDDVEAWAERVKEARRKVEVEVGVGVGEGRREKVKRDMRQTARKEVESASGSVDDDGGGVEGSWAGVGAGAGEELFGDIPVGIREFMKTEKKLRERKKKKVVAVQGD
ncbi:hypothetical protein FQN50_008937 [Emmonsiellopsis sp. PD_5]|nr:hypothetical protein FQN50_008937 [Emmonsiellopsis sp. PD_5]